MRRDAAPDILPEPGAFALALRMIASLVLLLTTEVLPRWRHRPAEAAAVARAMGGLLAAAWTQLRMPDGVDDEARLDALHDAVLALRDALLDLTAEARAEGRRAGRLRLRPPPARPSMRRRLASSLPARRRDRPRPRARDGPVPRAA